MVQSPEVNTKVHRGHDINFTSPHTHIQLDPKVPPHNLGMMTYEEFVRNGHKLCPGYFSVSSIHPDFIELEYTKQRLAAMEREAKELKQQSEKKAAQPIHVKKEEKTAKPEAMEKKEAAPAPKAAEKKEEKAPEPNVAIKKEEIVAESEVVVKKEKAPEQDAEEKSAEIKPEKKRLVELDFCPF